MSKSNTQILLAAVILLISVGIFSRLFFQVPSPKAVQTTFGEEFGLTFSNYDGKQVHLYDYRRKVLIAYAWASWCPYCKAELQTLAQLKSTYGTDLQVVAINRGEPLAAAKAFTDQLSPSEGIVFLLDPNDAYYKSIGGYAMPEIVFINNRGDIVFHQRGPMQSQDIDQKIQDLMK